jgi:serine O-acetyltransferase
MQHQNTDIAFLKIVCNYQSNDWVKAIDSNIIFNWVDELFFILFPEKKIDIIEIEKLWMHNKQGLQDIFTIVEINNNGNHANIVELFYGNLPIIYNALQQDAQAILHTDPAADSLSQIINSYPGFTAIAFYRFANALENLNITIIPRIIAEYAHSKTGIDIHPKATIGVPFIIDHGTGIVIGETCIIGKHVSIYQGVTLGALQVNKAMQEKKRHPTVEDHVVIYANATILGGSTIIGNNSIIGGNTFIVSSVDPFSMVTQSTKNKIINQLNNNTDYTFSI